jgi:hypothetical protein
LSDALTTSGAAAPSSATSPNVSPTEARPLPSHTGTAADTSSSAAAPTPSSGKAARDARYRAKLRERKGGASPASPGVASPASPPVAATPRPPPLRPEALRLRDLCRFVAVVWRVLAAVAFLVGRRLDPVAPAEIASVAADLLPLTESSPAFDRVVAFLAAPFNLLDLLASKLHKAGPQGVATVTPIRTEGAAR